MTRRALFFLLGLLATGALGGCSNAPTGAALGTLNVQLTDAPGNFEAVNLVVNEVAAHGVDGSGGWEVLTSQPRTYDLLQLRNGVFTTLGISPLPAGHYDQIRLKLGTGSTVKVDGLVHPLIVPSGLQSGYKIDCSFDVPHSGQADLAIDFDAARSITLTGNGDYLLEPVARAVTINLPGQQPGGIHGVVRPSGVATSVFAVQNGDTVASTLADDDGSFTVVLLPAGTYRLMFDPSADYLDRTVDGVVVNVGATTDVGMVELSPAPPVFGKISGQVSPAGVETQVVAMQGGSPVAGAAADPNGNFQIAGLPGGTYSVVVDPSGDYLTQNFDGVAVTAGGTTSLGVVELQLPPPPPPAMGAVRGQVVPSGIPTTVSAMQGNTVVGQSTVDGEGKFLIGSLPAGTYTLLFHAEFDFSDSTLEGVVVSSGATTDVGQVPLQP